MDAGGLIVGKIANGLVGMLLVYLLAVPKVPEMASEDADEQASHNPTSHRQ